MGVDYESEIFIGIHVTEKQMKALFKTAGFNDEEIIENCWIVNRNDTATQYIEASATSEAYAKLMDGFIFIHNGGNRSCADSWYDDDEGAYLLKKNVDGVDFTLGEDGMLCIKTSPEGALAIPPHLCEALCLKPTDVLDIHVVTSAS